MYLLHIHIKDYQPVVCVINKCNKEPEKVGSCCLKPSTINLFLTFFYELVDYSWFIYYYLIILFM